MAEHVSEDQMSPEASPGEVSKKLRRAPGEQPAGVPRRLA
jgi:hypothetical protein